MHGQSGFSAPRHLASLLLLSLGFFSFCGDAQAMPFHSKRKAQDQATVDQLKTYQPPAPNSLTVQCDPYRQDVILINHKSFLVRPFYTPRRLFLMSKHRKCIDGLMDQEYLYLKNAKIQITPKMPPVAMPLDLNQNVSAPENEQKPAPSTQAGPTSATENNSTGKTQEK